jgi:hypothetical protein
MEGEPVEELSTLHEYLVQQRYTEALELVTEMEEMSREGKINKIREFARILLLHLIKQEAEKRSTRSWDLSIRSAVREIFYTNTRRRAGGTYLSREDLHGLLVLAYCPALEAASLEAFGGVYDEDVLGAMVNRMAIVERAAEVDSRVAGMSVAGKAISGVSR